MYIDKTTYVSYGGTDMDAAAFARCEYAARRKVDRQTQGRVAAMSVVPEAVERLMVELISMENVAGIAQSVETPALASYSTDGYSESYRDTQTQEYVDAAEQTLIVEYLTGETDDNGVPLLYVGVD